MSVADLMGSMGVTSRHDDTFPDFVEAVDHLRDCGIIGSLEYDALPDDGKLLDLNQIWRVK